MPYHPLGASVHRRKKLGDEFLTQKELRDRDRYVEVVPGVIAATEFTYRAAFLEPDAPEITLQMRTGDNGTITCESLEITPRAGGHITAVTLRAIPIGYLIRDAATLGAARGTVDGRIGRDELTAEQEAEIESKTHPGRQRGYPVDDEELRRIANTYRAALKLHKPPTQHVAHEHVMSRTTASRWIRRARDAGYLGASRPSVAGEFGPRSA